MPICKSLSCLRANKKTTKTFISFVALKLLLNFYRGIIFKLRLVQVESTWNIVEKENPVLLPVGQPKIGN